MSLAAMLQDFTQTEQIRYYMNFNLEIKAELSSYLSALWKDPEHQPNLLKILAAQQKGEKTIGETFLIIRNRAIAAGVVDKLTNLRDGHLMFHLHAITAFINNDEPHDGYVSEADEEEDVSEFQYPESDPYDSSSWSSDYEISDVFSSQSSCVGYTASDSEDM